MKKTLFLSVLFLAGVLFSAAAKDPTEYKYEYQKAAISYRNVPVYKVLDQRDAYIVMYAKGHRDVGSVTVPKKWYSSNEGTGAKLAFRALPRGMQSYMTVIYREGAFERVILTMPTSKAASVWGVADSGTQVDDIDKETLEIEY